MKILSGSLFSAPFLLLAGCVGTPTLTDTWRDPAFKQLDSKKMIVLAVSGEESFRRVAEDELVRQLPNQNAVVSYDKVAATDINDSQKVLELAHGQGIDSALVMRVLEVDKVEQSVPASYSPVFMHFSDQRNSEAYYYPTRYDEGYKYTEKTYRVETDLYTLADDKLVWSGITQVRDPDSMRELVSDSAQLVTGEMRKQGLIR